MLNITKFISDNVTFRQKSMFLVDIQNNSETIRKEVEGKSLCVIGGAGSIGSSFIRAILPFKPSKLVVIDLNENGLAELTRDLRSTKGMYVPEEYRAYITAFINSLPFVVYTFCIINSLIVQMCDAKRASQSATPVSKIIHFPCFQGPFSIVQILFALPRFHKKP